MDVVWLRFQLICTVRITIIFMEKFVNNGYRFSFDDWRRFEVNYDMIHHYDALIDENNDTDGYRSI